MGNAFAHSAQMDFSFGTISLSALRIYIQSAFVKLWLTPSLNYIEYCMKYINWTEMIRNNEHNELALSVLV